MRTFKFRVWDKELKKFDSPNVHHLEKKDGVLGIVLNLDILKIAGDSRFIISQFTGLTDRNGKEIYEGDILASRGNYFTEDLDKNGNYIDLSNVVVWNKSRSRFGLIPTDEYYYYIQRETESPENNTVWNCRVDTFKEIIGNIYETPELIS